MNTLQFNATGLEEMTFAEMQEADGGTPIHAVIAAGIIIGAAIEIIQDWDNFKAGLCGGCHKPKS